jgi:hypothetical protein
MRIKHILGIAVAAFGVALGTHAAVAGEAAQAGAGNSAVSKRVSTFTLIRGVGSVGAAHVSGAMVHGGPSGGPKGNYSVHTYSGNKTVFFSKGMMGHHHHHHHHFFIVGYPYYDYDEGSCYWRCRQFHGPRFCHYRAYDYCY